MLKEKRSPKFWLKKIPHKIIKVNKISEESLGDIFSFFILETVILALSLKINPLDQPAVEEVKTVTKKALIKGSGQK